MHLRSTRPWGELIAETGEGVSVAPVPRTRRLSPVL